MPTRTAPERLLVRLEWRVLRRLDGRLAGGYRTAHRGTGTDLVGLREYTEGDDARHIDWNVTARLNEPQLRVFTEDRELTVWLVLDRSASMTVGAPGRGKDDVLGELALVLARLFGRGGNRVGALLYDTGLYGTGIVRTVPPGTGRRHALRIGAELARTAGAGGGRYGDTTDLAAMLDAVAKLARRRALIVVISDFIGDGDWGRSLLRLVTATRRTVSAGLGDLQRYISYGASPRASIALVTGARALAFLHGRDYVLPDDVGELALDVLRHRVVLSYEALADDITADTIITKVLDAVAAPEVVLSGR